MRHYVYETGHFDTEEILCYDETEWTMPKWAMPNDIVFFYHAKTAISRIRHLELQLMRSREEDTAVLLTALQRARDIYANIGGKIFAVGRVGGRPFYDDMANTDNLHWSSKIFAAIGDIILLANPIDLSEFSGFIALSRQSAITAVLGDDFVKLKDCIANKNLLPDYVLQSQAAPFPLKDMNNQNWLEISQEYRRSFFLEIQFRKYYVDFLLQEIGDRKKFYAECACYRDGKLTGYADNGIWINGKLCFVEVKLNVHTSDRIERQLEKYCYLDGVALNNEINSAQILFPDRVMIIDTEKIYFFEADTEAMIEIVDLDCLKTHKDLQEAKRAIVRYLSKAF